MKRKKSNNLGCIVDRVFSAAMVKAYCDRVYGRRISRNGWSSWRKWVGIKPRAKTFTFDQFCLIAAISIERSQVTQQVKKSAITFAAKRLSRQLEHQEQVANAIAFVDGEGVISGADAQIALQLNGVKLSRRSLYRKVPAFSSQATYSVDYLMRFVA